LVIIIVVIPKDFVYLTKLKIPGHNKGSPPPQDIFLSPALTNLSIIFLASWYEHSLPKFGLKQN